ncbi:hypothetical protein BSNT_06891 [Bacillus subtilis subsp. natto BEST195]|nr:hypothetical protein BSNT_06891 [Bacillus subtilis subsp. natto BEST195]
MWDNICHQTLFLSYYTFLLLIPAKQTTPLKHRLLLDSVHKINFPLSPAK